MKTLKNVFSLLLLTMVFLACEEPVGPGDPNGRYGSDPMDQEYGDWGDRRAEDFRTNLTESDDSTDPTEPVQ